MHSTSFSSSLPLFPPSPLSTGGYGSVFKAWDLLTCTTVAVKLIDLEGKYGRTYVRAPYVHYVHRYFRCILVYIDALEIYKMNYTLYDMYVRLSMTVFFIYYKKFFLSLLVFNYLHLFLFFSNIHLFLINISL
jgi:hypothetical protein